MAISFYLMTLQATPACEWEHSPLACVSWARVPLTVANARLPTHSGIVLFHAEARREKLKVGRVNIVSCLNQMPQTQHDPSSFTVDVPLVTVSFATSFLRTTLGICLFSLSLSPYTLPPENDHLNRAPGNGQYLFARVWVLGACERTHKMRRRAKLRSNPRAIALRDSVSLFLAADNDVLCRVRSPTCR